VAAVVAAAGAIWPAMAVLIIPGAVALLVLVRIRRSMGDPVGRRDETAPTATTDDPEHRESLLTRFHGRLPRVFWLFAAACATTTGGSSPSLSSPTTSRKIMLYPLQPFR
jgi:hypothetical protein